MRDLKDTNNKQKGKFKNKEINWTGLQRKNYMAKHGTPSSCEYGGTWLSSFHL